MHKASDRSMDKTFTTPVLNNTGRIEIETHRREKNGVKSQKKNNLEQK